MIGLRRPGVLFGIIDAILGRVLDRVLGSPENIDAPASAGLADLPLNMEVWRDDFGQRLVVHAESLCDPPCAIHSPSNHPMRDFKLFWRSDRRILERHCPHGVGHPDPDALAFALRTRGDSAEHEGIHGCDGCCSEGGFDLEV